MGCAFDIGKAHADIVAAQVVQATVQLGEQRTH